MSHNWVKWMRNSGISFSISRFAAWAPGIESNDAWMAWANTPARIDGAAEPKVAAMPPMLRRRAGQFGKMALEVAYACLGDDAGVDTVFCSRHGETGRAIDLLGEMARGEPLSPTAFGMAVHNANSGLFSIARKDRRQAIALAGGQATLENGLIEACALLADGAPRVLLVMADVPLPGVLAAYADVHEQPYAFAWLVEPARGPHFSLSWQAAPAAEGVAGAQPHALQALRFYLAGEDRFEYAAEGRRWRWSRHA